MGKPLDSDIRTVVTEALVGMIAGATNMIPPTDQPLPDFIQGPVDRAVERIKVLLVKQPASGELKPLAYISHGLPGTGEVGLLWDYMPVPTGHTRKINLYREPSTAQGVAGLVGALEQAQLFIRNGIELGYIRMPDADTPDPAHDTLPKIDAALAAHRAQQGDQGE